MANQMKRVFVLTMKDALDPAGGVANGYIEDVESGQEFRFHTVSELLQYLQRASGSDREEASPRRLDGLA